MINLWSANTPASFWQCDLPIADAEWEKAAIQALHLTGIAPGDLNLDSLVAHILGEAQFGSKHWHLSPVLRAYYPIRCLIPRQIRTWLRQQSRAPFLWKSRLRWPVEDRYVQFQWEVMRQLLQITGKPSIRFKNFWPDQADYAFILTHDIDTEEGQSFVRQVADLEEGLGFRSSFNFCADEYPVQTNLVDDLLKRGFEIGLHGLKHDNKLFSSKDIFDQHVERINGFLKTLAAVGFRSPSTHRQPEWMQALDIEYDLSFFDTDPWEPIPGGTMSIWPFIVGHFVELPYTLAQDNTLVNVLGEHSPRIWLDKVNFLKQYHGIALVNTHPDYLCEPAAWQVYHDFLLAMRAGSDYWHALPREAARWWRYRHNPSSVSPPYLVTFRKASIDAGQLVVSPPFYEPVLI